MEDFELQGLSRGTHPKCSIARYSRILNILGGRKLWLILSTLKLITKAIVDKINLSQAAKFREIVMSSIYLRLGDQFTSTVKKYTTTTSHSERSNCDSHFCE